MNEREQDGEPVDLREGGAKGGRLRSVMVRGAEPIRGDALSDTLVRPHDHALDSLTLSFGEHGEAPSGVG